ncbi:processed acidic surface protein [Peribacillus simplex]|uniref:Processed acidic surface protein n=2 Tax=Peribacillus TaxID=2675229 RepID=A0AA90T2Z6_9BACI|nr:MULTISPECIES: processed acidic surface protein [Peribacillus]MDP1421042.1 processed acidic surface protein [Peribacillus simplex]MDP1453809.1 processed acidic surface protein [Peribacillus frigoritolerans]
MKKLWTILVSFTLLISLFPQLASAAPSKNFEQELTKYLKEVSLVRGFEVTRDDIETSLSYYDESIKNFESIGDLKEALGEVIKADLSNLDAIYEDYNLTNESLINLLHENGEELDDYIFIWDLDEAVYFYAEEGDFERDPNFDKELVNYLANVSKERGFEVTKEDIEASLELYDLSTEEFESVEELSEFLGDVIKADLSNLDYFNENYGLDKQALLQMLEENGEDINDYIYIDNLEETVWTHTGGGMDGEVAEDLLPIFEEELGLTEEELQRLEDHLMSLEDHLSNPETVKQLEELGNRMMAFEEFDVATELTAEQIAEMASIYEELLSIFKLNVSYSLVKSGSESPVSLLDLMKLEELKGANLKIAIYTTDGKFLADLLITGDMVDSDTLTNAGGQIKESAKEVKKTIEKAPVAKPVKQKISTQPESEHQTVKGAKLPNTASDYLPSALLGLFIVLFGSLMYRKIRKA